ncbi:MAG: hypothetical protein LBR61_11955 [Synergistaceae bacterium]|jgi:hypothetical protein|nr:hypothetical protein [Synergistaceae bacterium]
MKKILQTMLKGLVFAAGIAIAAWVFMPWKQLGEAVLQRADQRLGESSTIRYSSVESARGGFLVRDLDARLTLMGLPVTFSCKTLTVVPHVSGSLVNMAPTGGFSFTGAALGEIPVLLKKIPAITLGDGHITLSASRRQILLEDIRSGGELALAGAMALTPSDSRLIGWADLKINVKSEAFEQNLPSLQSALGLPLEQEGPGRWVLRRDRPADKKGGAKQ